MQYFPAIAAAILGTLTSLLVIVWLLLGHLPKPRFLQQPDSRHRQFHHTHGASVPRFGGLAFAISLIAIVVGSLFLMPPANDGELRIRLVFLGSCLAMFGVGFWDDLSPLGARKKLILQISIATLTYLAGIQINNFKNPFTKEIYELGLAGLPVTVLWLVALTNLINIVDGIDGLAGGIGLFLMGLIAVLGLVFHGGGSFVTLAAAGMCGCLVSFLCYNFPPASIFMGDGGAYLIGYLIGTLTILSSQKGTILAALIAPLFALALPILDVALAILRRGLQGLPIFRADKKHLHHRLLQVGYTHTKTVLILYGISLVFLFFGFFIVWARGSWLAFTLGLAALVVLLLGRAFRFSREWFSVGRVLGNSLELRKETQYALTLARWLELEAERAESLDSLWQDFLFAARKLGFSSVHTIVAHQETAWPLAQLPPQTRQRKVSFDLNVASAKTLVFRAAANTMSDRLCAILGEILAECWLKISKAHDKQKAARKPHLEDAHQAPPATLSAPSSEAPADPPNRLAATYRLNSLTP